VVQRLVSLMNDHSTLLPMMVPPTPEEAALAVREAQRMFSRTLAAWAVDSLRLRRAGIDRAVWIETPDRFSRAA